MFYPPQFPRLPQAAPGRAGGAHPGRPAGGPTPGPQAQQPQRWQWQQQVPPQLAHLYAWAQPAGPMPAFAPVVGQVHQPQGVPRRPRHPLATLRKPSPAGGEGPAAHAPIGATAFARHMDMPRHLQTRHGDDCQTLRFRNQVIGAMSRYPQTPKALGSPARSLTNLMNRGDMGIMASYVENMPQGRATRIGGLEVVRNTHSAQPLGVNTEGKPMYAVRTSLHVRDTRHPEAGWQKIRQTDVTDWIDTTAPPLTTFEQVWRALYVPGQIDYGVIHCAGGVGRTGMVIARLAFQSYLDEANRAGRIVTPQEGSDFLDEFIDTARELRGGMVLPDIEQIRVLKQSCNLALARQRLPAGAPFAGRRHGPGAQPVVAPMVHPWGFPMAAQTPWVPVQG